MSKSNSERVGKGLELLKEGLAPFVEQEMKGRYGAYWQEETEKTLRQVSGHPMRASDVVTDVQAMFTLMWNTWHDVFGKTLGRAERTLVSELRDVRNKWAHQQTFSSDDTYRALDSVERLLTAIAAPQAREVKEMKQELLRASFADKARQEKRRASMTPVQGQPAMGLKPWREIVTPHRDVASGRYQQAEFAADLGQVHRGEGMPEYREPREFFRRTFLTEGLRHLLKDALLRLSGGGGAPVVELQTNFGGGKTHSMLALYHLFGGTPAGELAGVEEIIQEAGLDWLPRAHRAVLVGTELSPGQPSKKADGTIVRTMWGEMAWQLGGPDGYAMVAESDERGISPGSDILCALFDQYSPALILIDEWVRFVGQTYGKSDLPGGSFDANITFAQALTEAAKRSPEIFVVASIPASDIEMGGEGGKEANDRLKNTFSRLQSAWRPANTEEGFEIVRRRLFEPIMESHKFAARDAVITAFSQLYREQSQEFPTECKEGDYRRRMEAAYPIHPELFDRLYGSWSSLDKFQRTRGVLRLMASVIHALWERNDSSLLILPATIPVDEPRVQFELTRYLEDPWTPVIEKDVDGPASLPLSLDRESSNLGRFSAARRVARTIYMGSAPNERTSNRGIEEKAIKLGCVQPGESVATFGDALRRLTDQATHLYVDGKRYWYSTQPSVTRLGQDRAAQQEPDDVWEELARRLRLLQDRGDFAAVHIAPESSGEVPDEMSARLVVLGPHAAHSPKNDESLARRTAEEILNQRGNAPRLYRNMLVFLAPDGNRLGELEQSIRQYLAWKSIVDEDEELNLDAFQRNQAKTKSKQADDAVDSRIQETYIWLLMPFQLPQGNVEWEEMRLKGSQSIVKRASQKLLEEEGLITQFASSRLSMALEQRGYSLWGGNNHIALKQLWEYFASYLYLPRLRDQGVLTRAIERGVGEIDANFAYAEGWDEARNRYLNLKTVNDEVHVVMDRQSMIVKPEIASKQLAEDQQKMIEIPDLAEHEAQQPEGNTGESNETSDPNRSSLTVSGTGRGFHPSSRSEKKLRRYHGSAQLDAIRLIGNTTDIANEIIQHLEKLDGAEVQITIDISAYIPDGAPEDIVRTVTENSRTLKFKSYGFEEE